MGNSSSEILSQPLFAQLKPVAAINQTFCSPSPVTLHLREKAWSVGDKFSICDVNTNKLYFRIDGAALSMTDRKVLLDADDRPVVHMRTELLTFTPTFKISSDYDSHHVLFRIKTKPTLVETVLECTFRDVVTGRDCKVGLYGDWRARAAGIWLDLGDGEKLPVGRIYRPTTTTRSAVLNAQDYYLDIAPNMDAALMVIICIALDEANKVQGGTAVVIGGGN